MTNTLRFGAPKPRTSAKSCVGKPHMFRLLHRRRFHHAMCVLCSKSHRTMCCLGWLLSPAMLLFMAVALGVVVGPYVLSPIALFAKIRFQVRAVALHDDAS